MLGEQLFILLCLVYVANAHYRRTYYLPSYRDEKVKAIPTTLVKSSRTRSVSSDPRLDFTSVTITKRQPFNPHHRPQKFQPYRSLFKPQRKTTVKYVKLQPKIGLRHPSELRHIDELETLKSEFVLEPEIEIIESVPEQKLEPKFETNSSKPTILGSQSDPTPIQSESKHLTEQLEQEELPVFRSRSPFLDGFLEPGSKKTQPLFETETTLEEKSKPDSKPENQATKIFKSDLDIQCIDENVYYPIENMCDTFVECQNYVATKKICPDGLLFNRKAKWPRFPCSYPTEVDCGNVTNTLYFEPIGECPRRFGNFASNNNDCEKYTVCDDGRPMFMSCPMGLAFNSKIGACDWPANVPNCNPKVFKNFVCPVSKDDKLDKVHNYRYKKSCKVYFACIRGEPRLLRCDSGLSFDDKTSRCISSDAVLNCKSTSEIVDTKLFISKV